MNEQRIGGTTGRAQLPNRTTHITGWGHEVPSTILTNADLEKIVETSDEWITTRTGIRERRIAAEGETTASMASIAAARALAVAGINADDVDLIVVATLTPDHSMPSTAVLVKGAIGSTRAAAFDLSAASPVLRMPTPLHTASSPRASANAHSSLARRHSRAPLIGAIAQRAFSLATAQVPLFLKRSNFPPDRRGQRVQGRSALNSPPIRAARMRSGFQAARATTRIR